MRHVRLPLRAYGRREPERLAEGESGRAERRPARDNVLVSTIGKVVPKGNYRVGLLELSPTLVTPGTEHDYFAHEQTELWGTDPFWGLPYHPKTKYYRTPLVHLGGCRQLFEFV